MNTHRSIKPGTWIVSTLGLLVSAAGGCSADESIPDINPTGGRTATGGSPATGGSISSSGGIFSTGGTTGGTAAGGVGGSKGGSGGVAGTGVAGASGAMNGGASGGGASGSGGSAGAGAGGKGAGGTSTGGAAGAAGGGGKSTGGSSATGGTSAGGTSAGGTSTGGTSTGGTSTGGTSTGGNSSCPVQLVGWAAVNADGVSTTTGGGNVTPVRVTSASQLASLAGDSTPRVIEIAGTYDMFLHVKSNKTLIGIGANATILGGIDIVGTAGSNLSNVIVRNLNVRGRGAGGSDPGDSFAVRFAHHVWIDHCNIWDGPDGNLDITRGANYVTVSWSKFWYTQADHPHRLSSLVGGGADADNASTDTGKLNTTWHHNWWAELVQERMPRVLFGKGHIFNNYYTSSGNNYCVRAGANAGVLIQNNYFLGVSDPHEFADDTASITANGNVYSGTSGVQATGGSGTPFTTPPYPYGMDPAANVPATVRACVGPR